MLSKEHRNVRGVAVHPGTDEVDTVEPGQLVDDEINHLVAGGDDGMLFVTTANGEDDAVPRVRPT